MKCNRVILAASLAVAALGIPLMHHQTIPLRAEIAQRFPAVTASLSPEPGETVVTLPERGDGATTVGCGAWQVRCRPCGARATLGLDESGDRVYRAAWTATDVLYAPRRRGSEEFLLLRDASAPSHFAYDLDFAPGLRARLEHGAVVFAAGGADQLAIAAPTVIDAAGQHGALAHWELMPRAGGAGLVLAVDPGLTYPVLVDPSWTAVGTMVTARGYHSISVLPSGTVLAVGGYDGTHLLTSCESYDPSAHAWNMTGFTLNHLRAGHTATVLNDGRLLVAGGYDSAGNTLTATAETFNGSGWTLTGSLATARVNHVAALLPDGTVLEAGGIDGTQNAIASVEIFDPVNNVFNPGTAMHAARENAAAVLLGGKLLVAGGTTGSQHSGNPQASCELYDPVAKTWTVVGSMSSARSDFALVALPNGKALAIGGPNVNNGQNATATCELYDPVAQTWSPAASMPIARQSPAAVAFGTSILVAGGNDGGANNGTPLASCCVYDTVAGTWSVAPNLPAAASLPPAVLLTDGNVLLAGGQISNNTVVGASSEYAPATADQAPTLVPASAQAVGSATVAITLSGSDADGNLLTYSVAGVPAHGSVSLASGNQVVYAAAAGFHGTDTFQMMANDGLLNSSPATVSVAVDAPPTLTVGGPVSATLGAIAPIGTGNITANDPDTGPAQLVFTLVKAPVYGSITDNGNALVLGGTFTQADLAGGLVAYASSAATFTHTDACKLTVSDPFTTSATAALTMAISATTPVTGNPPSLVIGTPPTVVAGATVAFSAANLSATESGLTPDQLTYKLTVLPAGGYITFSGVTLGTGARFSQLDVNSGRVVYHQTAVPAGTTDTFSLTLSDGHAAPIPGTVTVDVAAQTVLLVDRLMTVHVAGTIGTGLLSAEAPGVSATAVTFTMTVAPGGELQLNGSTLAVGGTFTEDDLVNGRVQYQNDGQGQMDSFHFTVASADGTIPATGDDVFSLNVLANIPSSGSGQLMVNHGATVSVTSAVLDCSEAGVPDAQVVFSGGYTSLGQLLRGGVPVGNGTFTQDDVDRGLISYAQNQNDGEADTLNFTVNDGNPGNSYASIAITINHVPVLAADAGLTVAAGGAATVTASDLEAIDQDQGPAALTWTVTVTPTHGTLRRSGAALAVGATFTQADIDGGLITYTQDGAAATSDSFSASCSDGAGGTIPAVAVALSIRSGPVLAWQPLLVQRSATVAVDAGRLRTVEVGVGDSQFTYTLQTAPARGVIRKSGIALSAGGTFTQTDVDNGVIIYAQNGADGGGDSFAVTVADGLGGSASATIGISINHAPVLAVNKPMQAQIQSSNDFNLTTSQLQVTDRDQDDAKLVFTLSTLPTQGSLQRAQVPLTLGATFTQADIDDNLMSYQVGSSTATGADSFAFSVSDGAGGTIPTTTFSIQFASGLVVTNDQTLVVESSATIYQNLLSAQSPLGGNPIITWTVTGLPTLGTIAVNGSNLGLSGTFTSNDQQNGKVIYTVSATVSSPVSDSATFSASDGTNTLTGVVEPIEIVASPAITLHPLVVQRGGSATVGSGQLQVTDANVTPAQVVYTIGTAPTLGGFTRAGLPLVAGMRFTQDDVDNGLIAYVQSGADGSGDSCTGTWSDGLTGTFGFNLQITINHPPVLTADAGLTLTSTHQTGAVIGTGLLDATDPEQVSSQIRFTITVAPATGTLLSHGSALGVGGAFFVSDLQGGFITFNGNGADQFTFAVDDQAGGSLPAAVFPVVVAGGPPAVSATAAVTVGEGASVTFSSANGTGFVLSDPAGGANDSLTITANHGTATLGGTTGLTVAGNGSASVSASGSLANLSAAITGLVYAPNLGFTGSDSLAVTLTDGGQSGSATVAITVSAVNQTPTVAVPGAQSVNPGIGLAFSATASDAITVADSDAGGAAEQLSISAQHGTLTLASSVGLTVVAGASGSASVVVTGTLADLDAALNGLTYVGSAGYNGNDTVSVTIDDLGHSGAGGPQLGAGTVAVHVNAVPQVTTAPTVSGPDVVGTTLTASPGSWTVADSGAISFTYAWLRASDAAGTGSTTVGTSATYAITAADAHQYLCVQVTATNALGGAANATTTRVQVADTAPVGTVAPTISGSLVVGANLAANDGTWSDADGDAVGLAQQWQQATSASGANATAFGSLATQVLGTAQAHAFIRLLVTANDGHGLTATSATAWTLVSDSAPAVSVAPAVSGSDLVGGSLTVSDGSWTDADGDALQFAVQWQQADNAAGTTNLQNLGTSATQAIAVAQAHRWLRASVTASDGFGADVAVTTTWTQVGNSAPVAQSASASTTAGVPVAITLGASDADGDALTFAVVADPAHGAVGLTGVTATYTPTAGFTGSDTFTIAASDGSATSAAATITVTVAAGSTGGTTAGGTTAGGTTAGGTTAGGTTAGGTTGSSGGGGGGGGCGLGAGAAVFLALGAWLRRRR
jgi:hypothetical protein